MKVSTNNEPLVRRAPDDLSAPWLKGPHPKWIVVEPVTYYLGEHKITVPTGYAFNGSSVPRYLWWLYPPSFSPAWRGALIHDFGYSHLHQYFTKEFFDEALAEFVRVDGGRERDARRFLWATSTFGRGGWSK